MKAKEMFKDEEVVINYINENMILNDNNFTISDVIRIIRNNPEKSNLITKYIAFRRENIITEKYEKRIDDLFGDEDNETTLFEGRITSIWEHITTIKEGKYTYDKILKSYLKKLSENEDVTKDIYNNIIKVFRLSKNIYKDLVFIDIIGKINFNMFIEYNDFIKMINDNNNFLYLNVWLNDNYKSYLNNYNIKRIGELKRYLNEKKYNKEYSELYGLLPLLKESTNISDFIIEKYINEHVEKNNNIIFMLKIKNTKNNIITKIIDATYKKIKKGYEEVLSAFQIFFDSYEGRYIIKYILSIRDGYFVEEDLKKLFPKYYLVIEYLVKKNHIFGVKYNEIYDIYTSKDIPSDEYIIKSYNKYLTLEQYKKLTYALKDNISSTNMEVSEDIIIKRINKEYEKYKLFYAKGYVSVEYKICFLYNKEFSRGFQNINEFVKRYYQIYNEYLKVQNIMYVYFFKNEDMFCLKPKYQEKYFGFVSTYAKEYANKEEICLVHMICESYRTTFKLEDIVKSLKSIIGERKIKTILKHSLFYYQLKNHTYIKSDCLKITDEMKKYFFLVSKMTKEVMFEKIKERYYEFIKYYKIKNAKYLFQMVKKITNK